MSALLAMMDSVGAWRGALVAAHQGTASAAVQSTCGMAWFPKPHLRFANHGLFYPFPPALYTLGEL